MEFRQARLAALAALITLSGCATTSPQSSRPYLVPDAPKQAPTALSGARDQLAMLSGNARINAALRWSDQYLDSERPQDAEALLRGLNSSELDNRQHAHWLQNRLHALLALHNSQRAVDLFSEQSERVQGYVAEQQAQIEFLAADALAQQGNYLDSLRLRIGALPLLHRRQRAEHVDNIWQQLMQLSSEQLNVVERDGSSELSGWLSLAQLYRDPVSDLDHQVQAINDWQQQWPNHPAAEQLPDMLSALEQAAQDRPEQVAILIPESGPLAEAGSALRNGIMTAYYVRQEQRGHTPTLRFYDSGRGDVVRLYQQAVAEGADLVIGPLDRDKVSQVIAQGALPVPTLTLNYVEEDVRDSHNLFQFGLAPEDEARQIADYNLRVGASQAGVLYPEGSWGERVAQAFADHWQANGGSITAISPYQEGASLGDTVKELLLITESEQRSQSIRRFTNLKVDATPAPRQDMGILFLVANPSQGRQVKPALNFHYASDLPVYSTALIYSGKPNPQQDHDLNGVHFVDMPWMLASGDNPLRQASDQQWPDGHGRFERLYAMGIDAFRLQGRLNLLKALPGAELPGVTGRLTLQDSRIVRELDWATFQQGVPKPRLKEISDASHPTAQSQ